jgi:hypothetical protein
MTTTTTASWTRFAEEAPELADAIAGRFASHLHHVLATLRRDGAPRCSGTEVIFGDGQLWLGMMPGSRKALDLRRDARFALHSAPVETDLLAGDAKLAGLGSEVTDPAVARAVFTATGHGDVGDDALLFRLELTDASLVRVEGDHLVIDSWHPGGPARRTTRR